MYPSKRGIPAGSQLGFSRPPKSAARRNSYSRGAGPAVSGPFGWSSQTGDGCILPTAHISLWILFGPKNGPAAESQRDIPLPAPPSLPPGDCRPSLSRWINYVIRTDYEVTRDNVMCANSLYVPITEILCFFLNQKYYNLYAELQIILCIHVFIITIRTVFFNV